MDLSPHITALLLLSVIYFLLSGGGLVYLYYHYHEQLYYLKEQFNLQCLAGKSTDLSPSTAEDAEGCLCWDNEPFGADGDGRDDSSSYWDGYDDNREATSMLYCCTSNETQLKQLVDKWTQDEINRILPHAAPSGDSPTFGNRLQQDARGGLPVSALLIGKKMKKGMPLQPAPSTRETIISSWTVSNRRKGYINGIHMTRGRLTIPVEGYYLVYSKVNLRSEVSGSVFHETVVDNPRYRPEPQTLMRSALQACSSEDKDASHSSFHSGIYSLFDGDEVLIKISSPHDAHSTITFVPKDSFFGIYLLNES